MNYIKPFTQITKDDISLVGGKGLSLGIMINAGLPVPSGFVMTTNVYKEYYNQNIPRNLQEDILRAFDELNMERVAVRSSAIAEDSTTTSWAGQLETFLNITRENLVENINKCRDSIHSKRALVYAERQGITQDRMLVAVVVQKMVDSDISGVMFSVNPITKNPNEIMIEAVYGLGELLVQGLVTPSNFVLDKQDFSIKSKMEGEQDKMLIFQVGENKEVPLPENMSLSKILDDEDLKELGKYAISIEKIYHKPQDIEWAKVRGELFILQSRPITTL